MPPEGTDDDRKTMNCEQYREAIAADPTESFPGGREHASECDQCRALRSAFRTLDERIEAALAVTVPPLSMPELPDLPADDKVVTMQPKRRFTTPAWFGMAAGIALAAYIGLLAVRPDINEISLADQVIAHLDHEQSSRVVTHVAVPERTLDSVVSNDVERLDDGIGLISYARSCVINGKTIPHLVIQGENGPVTLLLMPDEPIDAAIPLEGNAVNGVILPVGNGSIAIIGERDEQIDRIRNRVVNSVKWKT